VHISEYDEDFVFLALPETLISELDVLKETEESI